MKIITLLMALFVLSFRELLSNERGSVNLGFGRIGNIRAVAVNPLSTINPGDFAQYDTVNHFWDLASNVNDPTKQGGLFIDQNPPQGNPYPSGSGIPSIPVAPLKIQDFGIWEPGLVLDNGVIVEDGSALIKGTGAATVKLKGAAPDTDVIGYANVPQGGQITGDGKLKISFRIRCNYPSSFLAQ